MEKTKRQFAVVGYPLGHTMSPPIHRALFAMSGPDSLYDAYQISPEELEQNIPMLLSLDGFNITIPHKVAILSYLDELDDSAQRYGSVNTVKMENGRYIGYNTDVDGFVKTIEQMKLPHFNKVCVLGCGGVGRMFVIECVRMGCEVTIAVREQNLDLARQVSAELEQQGLVKQGQLHISLLDQVLEKNDLLINATPVGMYPNCAGCPVPDKTILNAGAVFDAVYNPTKTLLLQKAEQFGVQAAGGMEMLVWQAVCAHQIWDKAQYREAEIEALVARMTREVDEKFPLDKAKSAAKDEAI